jgi:hypothetical protein
MQDLYVVNEAQMRIPEERLLLAVINLAVLDAMVRPLGKYPDQRLTVNANSAMRFLYGSGFERCCFLLGFNVHHMRRKLEAMSMERLGGKHRITEDHRRSFRANLHLWREKVRVKNDSSNHGKGTE